jgi:trehalose-6-phosphate synthase
MPAKGHVKSGKLRQKKVGVPDSLDEAIVRAAKACGMTESRFMRHVLMQAVGQVPNLPRPKKHRVDDKLLHNANQLLAHLSKIGVNVNQMAKQANSWMVPLKTEELQRAVFRVELAAQAGKAFFAKATDALC